MTNIVQTLTSECGCYRVEIEQRSERVFRLTAFEWHEEWVDGFKYGEGWFTLNANVVFTDTLENAERLAAEMLRATL